MRRQWYQGMAAFLLVLFLGTALFSARKLYQAWQEYKKGDEVYSDLSASVLIPEKQHLPETEGRSVKKESEAELRLPQIDVAALKSINQDFVAWLYIPGTDISYPVVQGRDNDYYLHHLFDKTKNKAGCLFLDYKNSPRLEERHSIIYGHNMKNGSMFAALTNYENQSFYDANPYGYLITPECIWEIQFFAGYITAKDGDSWKQDFVEEAAFTDWLQEIEARSLFQSDVSFIEAEQVITMSTCTYEFRDAHFVLHGRMHQMDKSD